MKKNLLIILQSIPYPLNTGGRQAVFNSIDAIKDDFNIYITCYNDDNQESIKALNKAWPDINIMPYIEDRKRASKYYVIKKGLMLLCRRVFKNGLQVIDYLIEQRYNHYNPQYYEYINQLIKRYSIDIVQCEFMTNLSLVYALPIDVKKVFVHHEIEYVRNEQLFRSLQVNELYKRYVMEMLKDNEIRALSKFDAVITLSRTDTEKLLSDGVMTKVYSSFSMVKTEETMCKIEKFEYRLSFVGPETHLPNKKGLEWFLGEVWPLLLSNSGQWSLTIIGNWSKETVASWESKYKNVRFAGFVENLRDALSSTIMIVPIHIGSGIRMKLLEAANIGIPFVSTTVGAEGLPFKAGEDCFIADSSDDFAKSLFRLSDINLQRKFVASAYNTINSQFSKEKLRESRMIAYNSL